MELTIKYERNTQDDIKLSGIHLEDFLEYFKNKPNIRVTPPEPKGLMLDASARGLQLTVLTWRRYGSAIMSVYEGSL